MNLDVTSQLHFEPEDTAVTYVLFASGCVVFWHSLVAECWTEVELGCRAPFQSVYLARQYGDFNLQHWSILFIGYSLAWKSGTGHDVSDRAG